MDKICDDFENVDETILRDVAQDGIKCGMRIERAKIVDARAQLIKKGLAKAYVLSSTEPISELAGMPPLDSVEGFFKTYFLATQSGADLQLSDDTWWPLRPS